MSTTIFENALLFDGVHDALRGPLSVLVEGKLVREISDTKIESKSAVRVACAGKTLMPGMIDCHVHAYAHSLRPERLRLPATYYAHYAAGFLRDALERGFTTVRDVAGADHGLATALNEGLVVGPRLFFGGLALSQTGGHGDSRDVSQALPLCGCASSNNPVARLVDGVDACVLAAREELRKGASHIKILASGGVTSSGRGLTQSQFSDPEISAIVEECDRQGAYVAAHCHPDEAILRCVRLGVRTIEHATFVSPETALKIAARGAFVVPTLAVVAALLEVGVSAGLTDGQIAKVREAQGHSLEGLQILKGAGVKIGFGTDLLAEQYQRRSLEFLLRSEVQSPYEILLSATSIGAEILGMEGKLGCIQPGAYADILLVDGNPLAQIDVLTAQDRIQVIMKDGVFIRRDL